MTLKGISPRLQQKLTNVSYDKIIIWHEKITTKLKLAHPKAHKLLFTQKQTVTGRTFAVIWICNQRFIGVCRPKDWRKRKDRPQFRKDFGRNVAVARALDAMPCHTYKQPKLGKSIFVENIMEVNLDTPRLPNWLLLPKIEHVPVDKVSTEVDEQLNNVGCHA